jgi:hypothetical protein
MRWRSHGNCKRLELRIVYRVGSACFLQVAGRLVRKEFYLAHSIQSPCVQWVNTPRRSHPNCLKHPELSGWGQRRV